MDIEKEIKSLEKKIGILGMLKRAKQAEYWASDTLCKFKATKDIFSPIRLFNTEQGLVNKVAHWEAVIKRIEKYYRNQ